MNANGVSVVTTTWNERENIKLLIQTIQNTLKNMPHEIIVVDDSSTDGTAEIAEKLADKTIRKAREGQTKSLLHGMKLAKYPVIVTIDADFENPPELIPELVEKAEKCDILVASRTKLPRISEKLASGTLGKLLGVKDVFSNFRVYKRETISSFNLKGGETFGGELITIAKKKGFKIGETLYESIRRKNPRIGGTLKANLRIFWALVECLEIYLI